MQPVLNKLMRVAAQVVPTTGLGRCPATQKQHVKASSEALFGLSNRDDKEVLAVWLCSECQGLFYTRTVAQV